MRNSKLLKNKIVVFMSIVLFLLVSLSGFTVSVFAASAYVVPYNIHNAIAYADKYAYTFNNKYRTAYVEKNGYAVQEDCTNFISQCLVAGDIRESNDWNSKTSPSVPFKTLKDKKGKKHTIYKLYTNAYETFVNAGKLKKYLSDIGYKVEKNINVSDNALNVSLLNPAPGDIVQFDWDGDGIVNHSVLCCGYKNGKLCYAAHSNSGFMKPFTELEKAIKTPAYSPIENRIFGTVIYVIHMTDTTGLKDVTSRYLGKTIAIKSLESGLYVSADTADQNANSVNSVANRSSAASWEYFKVESGDYGEVGFRSLSNGNYLSARLDISSSASPIRACYGKDYKKPQSWESFRIYEKNGIQYIQSQANGKWVQVNANEKSYPLQASAPVASTWERFHMEIVTNTSSTNIKPAESFATEKNTSVVGQRYGSGYDEGKYTGEWSNGVPNGQGKLEYIDYNGDGKFYKFELGGKVYNAKYYEGNFLNGARYGHGIVVYDGGWKEDGTYYGAWEKGKKVFEGRIWHSDGIHYLDGYLTATSPVTGDWTWTTTAWQCAK